MRTGIVGLGGHGRTLQYWIQQTEGLDVESVYDVSTDERARSVGMFDCYEASSFDDLIEHGNIDAVVIATPNHLHRAQVETALNAGLHVLVEKPIANTAADGISMMETAAANKRLLMVGHNMRFNRASRQVKALLESREHGDIVSAEIHFSANNTPHYPPDSWRLQPDYCPLLPVTQLGVHGIDLIHYFIGRITEVFASGRSVTVMEPVIDSVSALMHTSTGVAVTMTSNYCSPVLFECRIATTKRNIIYTPHSVEITPEMGMQGPESEWTRHDYHDNTEDGYEVEMRLFRDAVASSSLEVEAGATGGLQALAVDEALRKSIETRSTVEVIDYSKEVRI